MEKGGRNYEHRYKENATHFREHPNSNQYEEYMENISLNNNHRLQKDTNEDYYQVKENEYIDLNQGVYQSPYSYHQNDYENIAHIATKLNNYKLIYISYKCGIIIF